MQKKHTHDKVGVEKLDFDAGALELTAEGLRPSRDERLAAGVDGEERRRDERSKGSDREDESALARDHPGDDQFRDLERCVAVFASRVGQPPHNREPS